MSKVELVWATPDAEKLVVKMARVSNPTNEDNWETGPKLLGYLMKHNHWSPFEMVNMCVKIETERDIAAKFLGTAHSRSRNFQLVTARHSLQRCRLFVGRIGRTVKIVLMTSTPRTLSLIHISEPTRPY